MLKMIKCLIVDDEFIAREIIASHLSKIDNLEIVAQCKNAIAAFNYINKTPIDLVFLDINMPIMNGFSFIKSLDKLSDRVVQGMRIVLLTQSDSPQDIKEAKKFDKVIDYVVKPLNAEKIKALNL